MIQRFDPQRSVLLQPTEALRKIIDRSPFEQAAIRLDALSDHYPMVIQRLAVWTGSVSDELGSLK
jgi:hypothetical protein